MIPLELHIVSSEDYSNPKDSIFPILIPECEDDDFHEERQQNRATPSSDGGSSATPSRRHNRRSNENYQHTLTPLHHNGNRKRHDSNDEYGGAVSCNKCLPHHSHRDNSPSCL
ncbi:BnaC05g08540D [Brassica napus]|uniref:BnaC05g08540D protein n=1 Tax=Brassica napus TaxID=3708 RepID=A0A078FY70_BRANA|nr:BnaC05g08540D [Brassica napus]